MRKLLILSAFAALALTACAEVQQVVDQVVPATPKTPQQTVYEVKAGLVSAEDGALAWAAQACPVAGSCQDAGVKAVMNGLVTADSVVTAAETAVKANAAGSSAAVQAATDAQAALTAFQSILTQYGVQTTATTSTTGN